LGSDTAPAVGEREDMLWEGASARVEHIVSGRLEAPVDYDQDDDEWVLVLAGSAEIEIHDEVLDLAAGDWLLLPARTPHRLLSVEPGTRWLALHARRG
jgi:mannose-6-phosphate isomerase-like protein (cupin superfamily)